VVVESSAPEDVFGTATAARATVYQILDVGVRGGARAEAVLEGRAKWSGCPAGRRIKRRPPGATAVSRPGHRKGQ